MNVNKTDLTLFNTDVHAVILSDHVVSQIKTLLQAADNGSSSLPTEVLEHHELSKEMDAVALKAAVDKYDLFFYVDHDTGALSADAMIEAAANYAGVVTLSQFIGYAVTTLRDAAFDSGGKVWSPTGHMRRPSAASPPKAVMAKSSGSMYVEEYSTTVLRASEPPARVPTQDVRIALPLGMDFEAIQKAGKIGFFIHTVFPGGHADRTESITAGLQIVSINGQKVTGFSKESALIKMERSPGVCTLGVQGGDKKTTTTDGRVRKRFLPTLAAATIKLLRPIFSGTESNPAPKVFGRTELSHKLDVHEIETVFKKADLLEYFVGGGGTLDAGAILQRMSKDTNGRVMLRDFTVAAFAQAKKSPQHKGSASRRDSTYGFDEDDVPPPPPPEELKVPAWRQRVEQQQSDRAQEASTTEPVVDVTIPMPMGLSIESRRDDSGKGFALFISDVKARGNAEESEMVAVGQRVVKVNGRSIAGFSKASVDAKIRQSRTECRLGLQGPGPKKKKVKVYRDRGKRFLPPLTKIYSELKRIFEGLEDDRTPKVLQTTELAGKYTNDEVTQMLTKTGLIGFFTSQPGGYLDMNAISQTVRNDAEGRYRLADFVDKARVAAIKADKTKYRAKRAEKGALSSSVIVELKALYKAASQGTASRSAILRRADLQHPLAFEDIRGIVDSSGLLQYFDADHKNAHEEFNAVVPEPPPDLPKGMAEKFTAIFNQADQGAKKFAGALDRTEVRFRLNLGQIKGLLTQLNLLSHFDTDGDGEISMDEIFGVMDTDNDGKVSFGEFIGVVRKTYIATLDAKDQEARGAKPKRKEFKKKGSDKKVVEVVTVSSVFKEAAGHSEALVTFAAFSVIAIRHLVGKAKSTGKAYGHEAAPIKFAPTRSKMVKQITETFAGFGELEQESFDGFGDAQVEAAAKAQLEVIKPTKKSFAVNRKSSSARITNWMEPKKYGSSVSVDSHIPQLPPTVIRALIALIEGAEYESVADALDSVELEHTLTTAQVRQVYQNAGLLFYMDGDGLNKLAFDVVMSDMNKDRDGMVSLKLFINLTAMKADDINRRKADDAAARAAGKPRQPFAGARVKKAPAKANRVKALKKAGFFNTLRRKKIRGGGTAHAENDDDLTEMKCKRTMDFPVQADYMSCQEGEKVHVVRDLPDGDYIVETPQGRRLLHKDAFTKRKADDFVHLDLDMFKGTRGSSATGGHQQQGGGRRVSKWKIFGE